MSLGTKLVQAVQKEAAMNRPLPMTAQAEVAPESGSGPTLSAQVVLADNDRYSHLAEEVTISVAGLKAARGAKVVTTQGKAERFIERATYLTEALQFVECDHQGAAVVRSSPQTMRGPQTDYYEARVEDAALSLRRYRPKTEAPGRDAIPFCVTDDVLSRLADDAADVLQPKRKG